MNAAFVWRGVSCTHGLVFNINDKYFTGNMPSESTEHEERLVSYHESCAIDAQWKIASNRWWECLFHLLRNVWVVHITDWRIATTYLLNYWYELSNDAKLPACIICIPSSQMIFHFCTSYK